MQAYKNLIPDLQLLTQFYFGHVVHTNNSLTPSIHYSTKQNFKKSKATNCIFINYEITSIDHRRNPDIPKLLNCTGIPKIETHTLEDMFDCSQFNGDISQWDTSNVTNMRWMFRSSQFNRDISQWDTSKVTDMSWMFAESQFKGDISQWGTSNVTDMSFMFAGSQFSGDISQWNTSNVANMRYMFSWSRFKGDISKWNTSKVTHAHCMFFNSQFNREMVFKWGNFSHLNINDLI